MTKLTNFGVFVELEPGLEGLLHISELADHKVDSPEEVVKVGDEIEVKILRVDRGERKIGLSRKKAHWTKADGEREEGAPPATPTAAEAAKETKELKGGLGGGGPLFSMGGPTPPPRGRAARRGPVPTELPRPFRTSDPNRFRAVAPAWPGDGFFYSPGMRKIFRPDRGASRFLQPCTQLTRRISGIDRTCRRCDRYNPVPSARSSRSTSLYPQSLRFTHSSSYNLRYILYFQNQLKLPKSRSDTSWCETVSREGNEEELLSLAGVACASPTELDPPFRPVNGTESRPDARPGTRCADGAERSVGMPRLCREMP